MILNSTMGVGSKYHTERFKVIQIGKEALSGINDKTSLTSLG